VRDVVASPKTLVLRELDVADRVYSFIATVERLAGAGVVGRDDARRWLEGELPPCTSAEVSFSRS
jgi:hypothetical protein